MGDARATVRHQRAYKRERGLSAIELVATMALMGVVAGVAMPSMTRQPYALWNAQTTLIGDLRQARSESITRGDHYRVDITGASTYTVSRMQLNADGTWTPRVPAWRSRTLPSNVQIVSGSGLGFEFNTRGLMVNPSWAATLVMYDYDKSLTRWVTIWPSGQVAPGS
jgi:hypothetical protein